MMPHDFLPLEEKVFQKENIIDTDNMNNKLDEMNNKLDEMMKKIKPEVIIPEENIELKEKVEP